MCNRISIRSFLDLDWTKKPYIFFLIFLFVISRIPLLNLGFGSDPDAWRIANSAFDLHYLNIYHPSRFPGYPLPEFFNSLIINYGWLATNIATMIISLISVIIFAEILKKLNIKNKGLMVITYAFLPIIWINSASTMDYMWALTFIILTWFFIIRKQYALAGLMMGLAIGSRITSAILILPFIYLILIENKHLKNVIYYLVIASTTALILCLPLFFQYNLKFLTYAPMEMNIISVWQYINYSFGVFAVSFGIMLFVVSYKFLLDNILKRDKFTFFLLSSIVAILILFVKTPYEVAYLIPAIPFLLVLMSNISKRKFFVTLCILLMLNSFISFTSADISDVAKEGILMDNIKIRTTIMETQKILTSNIENSVVITGEHLPSLNYFYRTSTEDHKVLMTINGSLGTDEYWNCEKNVKYIYLAPLDEIKKLQKKGYKLYYMGNSTLRMTKYVYEYDLSEYNGLNILI